MANPNHPHHAFDRRDSSTYYPITNSLPSRISWPLRPQAPLDGFAFWYRPDQSYLMPRRHHNFKTRPSDVLGTEVGIKHRRTRDGCFTCRQRRVKCDESRPVCDRCRKGNRECGFPPPSKPSKRKSRHGAVATSSHPPTTALREDEKENNDASGAPERDQKKGDYMGTSSSPVTARQQTIPAKDMPENHNHDRSGYDEPEHVPPSPSARRPETLTSTRETKPGSASTDELASGVVSLTPTSWGRDGARRLSSNLDSLAWSDRPSRWAHLSSDLQLYLQYQQESMTYCHYFFKIDNNDFVHTDLIDLALQYDFLLYAVVGFAAYHHTLARPDGKLSQFLGYYSKAMSLLRSSLEDENHQSSPATLLTILQLATCEEYLGDWVQLIGHHRAAHQLLIKLYNPQTIVETEVGRQIFGWHSRYDVMVSLMTANATVLDREWYVEYQRYHDGQVDPDDADIENNIAAACAELRCVAVDIAAICSKLSDGSPDVERITEGREEVRQAIFRVRERIEALNDDYYTAQEFPDRRPLTDEDIVDPYQPGGLFVDVFWPLNHLWVDWYALYQMFSLSMMTILQEPLPPQMEALSLDQCRILGAIERWPHSPPGSLLRCHESLVIAAVFLKKDTRHNMWCRRKLAAVSRQGYLCPPAFRKRMAELWNEPDVEHWWLPNEEGFSPLLKDIRALGEDRGSTPTDPSGERVKSMGYIFEALDL